MPISRRLALNAPLAGGLAGITLLAATLTLALREEQLPFAELALVLATALTVSLWFYRRASVRLRAQAKSAPVGTETVDESTPAEEPPHPPTALLSSWSVVTGESACALDLLGTARQGGVPKPDAELRDLGGFPAFAARCSNIETSYLRDRFGQEGQGAQHDDEELWRALALLEQALPPALASFAEPASATVDLIWLLPDDWPPRYEHTMRSWLGQMVQARTLPALRATDFVRLRDDARAFEILDSILAREHRTGAPSHHLMIGAVSHVTQETVDRWSASRRLFGADCPEGLTPGEAAVVLTLTTVGNENPGTQEALTRVHRPATGMRESLATQPGAKLASPLPARFEAALMHAGLDAPKVASVVSDTDHRPSRSVELFTSVSAAFPELEPLVDVVPLGTVSGFISPLGGLVSLCCAAESARTRQAPALCVTAQASLAVAALIAAPAPPAPTAPSNR